MSIATLTFGDLTIEGASCAGEETWFRIRPPGLGFDAGRGSVRLAGVSQLFLSHCHLDHALGVPFLLSLRAIQGGQTTRVHMPAAAADPMRELIRVVERLEDRPYDCEIVPIDPGARLQVGRNLVVEAFATDHIVPSLGYHLIRTKGRLKEEFRGLSGSRIKDLKDGGVAVEDRFEEIWLSYCGDTGPAVFDLEPRLYESTVLLIECTFFDADSVDKARLFRHMHLEDFVARAERFRNADLVLHHMSRRYDRDRLAEIVEQRLALETTRIHLFGCTRE